MVRLAARQACAGRARPAMTALTPQAGPSPSARLPQGRRRRTWLCQGWGRDGGMKGLRRRSGAGRHRRRRPGEQAHHRAAWQRNIGSLGGAGHHMNAGVGLRKEGGAPQEGLELRQLGLLIDQPVAALTHGDHKTQLRSAKRMAALARRANMCRPVPAGTVCCPDDQLCEPRHARTAAWPATANKGPAP